MNQATPGEQLWASRYNGPTNDTDQPRALEASPDGSKVFVTGYRYPPSYATFAYDASTGTELWTSFYSNGLSDSATALGVSPDGSKVFVTGQSNSLGSGGDYATVAYDASTGAQLWVSRYNSPANDNDDAYALEVSPDGSRVFVTGVSLTLTSGWDYATVAYNASTGAQLWVRRYDGPAHQSDIVHALGVSPDGSTVFVTGESVGLGTNCGMFSTECNDYATVAYKASTGAKRWLRRWNGPSKRRDTALALAVSFDGSKVFVTGFADQSEQRWGDYATVAYEAATGAQLWGMRYKDPDDAQDQPTAIGVSPDGTKVFVTGFTYQGQARYYDHGTIAYDAATGAQLWARRHNGPQSTDDRAFALGISPDGSRVYVTGSDISTPTGADFATVAYDASSGAVLWINHYDAGIGMSNDDTPFALGVSADGSKVFVTGRSSTPSTSYDIATVAIGTV